MLREARELANFGTRSTYHYNQDRQNNRNTLNINNLAHTVLRVGLGLGLGVKALLLTGCCRDGEKHCLPSLVGDSDSDPLP